MSLDQVTELIWENILAAKAHLAEIKAAKELLETAGMYPAIPHFQWQRQADDALAYSQKWPKTELSTVGAAALPGQPHRDENAVSI